ncbi:dihydrofolate reductase family protein [Longispora sp. K20-0274]|uniref:dihydrofolate reductase family protein n=1 Tax=Longispora sp. K20-0274 TaxID=3088255 RepID=UPI00399C0684
MRKLTYYVGATIDGYIADPDGRFDFFPLEGDLMTAMIAEYPEVIPTRVRGFVGVADAPNERFDTVLMGRGSYQPALDAGDPSPYAHLRQYVFSRTLPPTDPAVEIVAGDPVAFVRTLKERPGRGIYLCGGGNLAGQLLGEIDELIVKTYPIVAGSGIPMFGAPFAPNHFARVDSRTFDTGTVSTFVRA